MGGGGQQDTVKINLMNTEVMSKEQEPAFNKESQQMNISGASSSVVLSDQDVTEEVAKEVVTIDDEDDTATHLKKCSGDRTREEIQEDEPRSEDEVIIDE